MRRVHGEATECIVFMGRQWNASCSWRGNGMRRVHWEATEHVGPNWLGRNGMRGCVHREGLDGTGDGNEAWHTAERRKRPCVRPATFETGSCSSGGVWRTAKRTKRTSYGRNGGLVDREGCGVPQNGRNGPPTVEMGVLFIRRGVVNKKRGSTGYCSSPPSTSSSLHRLPSTSSSLHGLLFIQPPPATVQPPLHGHPYTVYCSSSPPRGRPVHSALHGVLFIQPQPARSIGVLFIQRQCHRSLFIQTPRNAHCSSQRQHRSASVRNSSEGIARSGSVNSHRSIARVH